MNSKYLTLFLPFLFFFLFLSHISAQNKYTFTFQNNSYWNNPLNWVCTNSAGNCPPGSTINAGDTVFIDGYCVLNPNLVINNQGTIIVSPNGTLTIEEVGNIDNHGKISVFGILGTETGDFEHHSGSTVIIHPNAGYGVGYFGKARFRSNCTVLINGDFTVESGGNLFISPGANITIGSTGQWIIL